LHAFSTEKLGKGIAPILKDGHPATLLCVFGCKDKITRADNAKKSVWPLSAHSAGSDGRGYGKLIDRIDQK
jgi:hypothetical protein